ncbi:MAG: hypothetical protein K6G58_03170 [Lachnospiraceae bacterium]|nr:hypothetical protein [Lachnospiraceae bacterium]
MKKLSAAIMTAIGCLLLGGCQNAAPQAEDPPVKAGELVSFDFHPGYGDMEGGYHHKILKKNEGGEWIIECTDQETFDSPQTVTVYAAPSVAEFESFLKESGVLALSGRGQSDLFVTDYHPWSVEATFDNSLIGGTTETYRLEEYREYSERDRKILSEMWSRFKELQGDVISETVTEDEEDEPEDEPEAGDADGPDYMEIYAPVLEEVKTVVEEGYDFDRTYEYISNGLMEKVMYPGDTPASESVGYLLADVSSDGVPELLIACNEDYGDGPRTVLFSIFTVKDGMPATTMESWARSCYCPMEDNRFYYFGSGGAMITIFGEAHLSADGTQIEWDDFYFTDEKDGGALGMYHNTTGVFDAAAAEELSVSEEEFLSKMDEYEKRLILYDLTPLAGYEGSR